MSLALALLMFRRLPRLQRHPVRADRGAAGAGAAHRPVAASPPMFTGVFMDKMVGFIKLYFPVFLLGAVFGKVIELSGFRESIVAAVIGLVGRERAMLSIVLVCALLTYGGVSLFVVVFAVYPFAAEMFRQGGIPKRLIPATIALGAFTFTMDALPGTPQIQNIIPTTFFKTNTWAAPWLGVIGAVFILVSGLRTSSGAAGRPRAAGEGYGTKLHQRARAVRRGEAARTPGSHSRRCVDRRRDEQCCSRRSSRSFYGGTLFCRAARAARSRWSPRFRRSRRSGRWKARCCSASSPSWRSPSRRLKERFAEGSKAAIGGALLARHEHRVGVRLRRSDRRRCPASSSSPTG